MIHQYGSVPRYIAMSMAQAVSTCLDSIVHEAPTCLLVGSRCSYHPWMLPVTSSIGQYFICSMCSACLPDWCLLVVRARGLAFLQDFIALSRMPDFLNRYELGRSLPKVRSDIRRLSSLFLNSAGPELLPLHLPSQTRRQRQGQQAS